MASQTQQTAMGGGWLPGALFICLAFALPPGTLGGTLYGALLLFFTLGYMAWFRDEIIGRAFFGEYWLFSAIAAAYVIASLLGLFTSEGRLAEPQNILTQAAGLLLFVAMVPAFTHACARAFPRHAGKKPYLLIIGGVLISVLLFRSGENMIQGLTLYGALAPVPLIQLLIFAMIMETVPRRSYQVMLLLLPMPFLGAATNTLVQGALIVAALSAGNRKIFATSLIVIVCAVAILAFPPEFLIDHIQDDANANVRSRLWNHAIPVIAANPLGIGYGGAWTQLESLSDWAIWQVYKHNPYSALDIANHNSFIDIALRLGLPGLFAFLALIFRSWRDSRPRNCTGKAEGTFLALVLVCAINPGIESARSAMFVAFALALLRSPVLDAITRARHQPAAPLLELTKHSSPAQMRANIAKLAPENKRG